MEKSDDEIREEIKDLSAKILRALEQNGGKTSFSGLQNVVHENNAGLLHEALGWMERLGKIRIKKDSENVEIELAA
ncbi:MAG TPA: hypothetical protein VD913_04335 [bacterium]|nr:hypothetical protein [bacterium]